MKLTPLKSSNIDGCHYDRDSKTLTLKFKSGGTYAYADCPQEHYDKLCKAESPGGYFKKNILGQLKHTRKDKP